MKITVYVIYAAISGISEVVLCTAKESKFKEQWEEIEREQIEWHDPELDYDSMTEDERLDAWNAAMENSDNHYGCESFDIEFDHTDLHKPTLKPNMLKKFGVDDSKWDDKLKEDMDDILSIHTYYTPRLIMSATGASKVAAVQFLEGLIGRGHVDRRFEVYWKENGELVGIFEEYPRFPIKFTHPDTGETVVALNEDSVVVEMGYQRTEED